MSGSSREEVTITTGIERVRASALNARRTSRPLTLGSLQVEQDDLGWLGHLSPGIGAAAEDEIESLGAVLHEMELVGQVALFERPDGQFGVMGVVLDQQNVDRLRIVHAYIPPCFRVN
jgi:hypothetical protein